MRAHRQKRSVLTNVSSTTPRKQKKLGPSYVTNFNGRSGGFEQMPLTMCKTPGCRGLARPRRGGYCEACQPRRSSVTERKQDYGKLYGSVRWQKSRRWFLRNNPLCKDCLERGRTNAAKVVDHIVAHRGDLALFWDQANWQALCISCHNFKCRQEQVEGRNPYIEKAHEQGVTE